MGNDLTKGTTYVDGQMLNAANLNAHVDDAALRDTCISSKPAQDPIKFTDEFLLNDSGTLKKATGQKMFEGLVFPGSVLQTTIGTYTANANLATQIPVDDTIPQIGEGTQIISVSFTPRFVNSKMVLSFSGFLSSSVVCNATLAIFRDSIANAIAATTVRVSTIDLSVIMSHMATDIPATASTITYTVRVGPNAAGNIRFNGTSTARYFGGASAATLEVQEVRMP